MPAVTSVVLDSLQPHGLKPARLLLSMGFPRQEHWSGVPFSPWGDLFHSGIEPVSLALAGRFFTIVSPGMPLYLTLRITISSTSQIVQQHNYLHRRRDGKRNETTLKVVLCEKNLSSEINNKRFQLGKIHPSKEKKTMSGIQKNVPFK